MVKSKTTELTNDEEALLKEFNGEGNTFKELNIPFLAMNIASEDAEGKEIPVKTFTLIGSGDYSKSVRFRPLAYYNKLISMKQDGKVWKTTNETIFYTGREQPIDARGGIGCGRLLGKAIPEGWTEEQKKSNKAKAQYYGFLFGFVEFPGKEPVLCNFRVPSGKAVQVSNALQELKDKHGGRFTSYMLNLKLLSNPKDKSSPHPVLEIEPDVSSLLPTSGIGEQLITIKNYVDNHNSRIRASHQSAKLARQGVASDAAISNSVDIDEEIPF